MSTVKANDLQNASGGIPTVKGQRLIPTAWVNFNGTGTVAIRDSENVSSITDDGTGKYKMNFTTVMANTSYLCTFSAGFYSGNTATGLDLILSTVSVNFQRILLRADNTSGTYVDSNVIHAVILGGQA